MGSLPIFYLWRGNMQVVELIEQAVAGLGYETVDIESSPRGRLLRVFIDKAAGVTVDDCVTVSNHLTRLFMAENVDYERLEVSSPGFDRPLKKMSDYERFAGQEVQLKLRLPLGSQRNFSGVIGGIREGLVVLQTAEGEREFPFENVEKARLVPKF